jgi:HEAT repeat protein
MSFEAEIAQIVTLLHESWRPWQAHLGSAARLAALLRIVPAAELRSLDWSVHPSWEKRQTTEWWLSFLKKHCSGVDGWAWLAIASVDRSGFVREAAVRLLGENPPPEAIPFLMLRTADWVPQIRLLAEGVLEAYYPGHSYAELLPTLGVALGIESRLAGLQTTGARAFLRWLSGADDGFLVEALGAGDLRTARWSLRLLIERQSGRLAEAVRAALTSGSTSVRFEAAKALGKVSPADRRELLEPALEDRIGFVRRAALEAVPLQEVSQTMVERLLTDSNRSIREVAQREFRGRNPETSPAAVYRGLLVSARAAERASGLIGLGEAGGHEDAAEAVVRLEDATYRVRVAALRCLAKLSPEDSAQAALSALHDRPLRRSRAEWDQ